MLDQSYAPVRQKESLETSLENRDENDGVIRPLELEESNDNVSLHPYEYLFTWSDSWLISLILSVGLVLPALVALSYFLIHLLGPLWVATPFALHLFITLMYTQNLIPFVENKGKQRRKCWDFLHLLLEICLFGIAYRRLCTLLVDGFFTEIDETIVLEWTNHAKFLKTLRIWSFTLVSVRLGLALITGAINLSTQRQWETRIPSFMLALQIRPSPAQFNQRIRTSLKGILRLCKLMAFGFLVATLWSCLAHFGKFTAPVVTENCEMLDETECLLPFPSMHHLQADPTTVTGWRVHLQALPPLRGWKSMKADFVNALDGFSTMAPMLFYMEGLKEAHEAGIGQLIGAPGIVNSTSSSSITLLLEVKSQKVVPHSAEVDYLDKDRPLVMVFPAEPLYHNTHYALAVLNARDLRGAALPPTRGLSEVLENDQHPSHSRFVDELIPALRKAASWFDPSQLQLMFDFHTISKESQLGTVRSVRDATLRTVNDEKWGGWEKNVKTVKVIDNNCKVNGTRIARTVHAELNVPWFLGPGGRYATMDYDAVRKDKPNAIKPVKFVVHIPCSVRNQVLKGSLQVNSVMEYGHGLFYSRAEASDKFLQVMANQDSFIITAMDWRGMSVFDLLVVARVLLAEPHLFEAIRDNLIQGYCAKFALQEFSRKALLSMNWLKFGTEQADNVDNSNVSFTFYGISQGGILGAGYMGLSSGSVSPIDRGVLGVPGTPFALVMSRSLDFVGYDALMLLSFFNNRHVRIFLSVAQMAWDSVEASGVFGKPISEPLPRLLLQSGLGDVVVTSTAAEALARATRASTLPGNPRSVFGIPVEPAANATSQGPRVTLTEISYEQEVVELPSDDLPGIPNNVHFCVRLDAALISQVTEFISTGRVLDPCAVDSCRRPDAHC